MRTYGCTLLIFTFIDTLKWHHLAPTAPDTLNCYPHFEQDPFIMEKAPNLYFSGNMATFESSLAETGTRMVCVPEFASTKSVVLVDLSSPVLECHEVVFKV